MFVARLLLFLCHDALWFPPSSRQNASHFGTFKGVAHCRTLYFNGIQSFQLKLPQENSGQSSEEKRRLTASPDSFVFACLFVFALFVFVVWGQLEGLLFNPWHETNSGLVQTCSLLIF